MTQIIVEKINNAYMLVDFVYALLDMAQHSKMMKTVRHVQIINTNQLMAVNVVQTVLLILREHHCQILLKEMYIVCVQIMIKVFLITVV